MYKINSIKNKFSFVLKFNKISLNKIRHFYSVSKFLIIKQCVIILIIYKFLKFKFYSYEK